MKEETLRVDRFVLVQMLDPRAKQIARAANDATHGHNLSPARDPSITNHPDL
jgi:hypothetical protein